MTALFERDGARFIPTELTRGPWIPTAQHGGPPSALLCSSLARYEGGDDMFVARATIELLRPVPLTPLDVRTRFSRPGRKVQLVEASLWADTVEVARATGLRIRLGNVALPEGARASGTPPAGPASGAASLPSWNDRGATVAYHSHAVDHRFVSGRFDALGPATDWIRLRVPLIEGETTAPIARVAAAADFGNGISSVLSRADGYSFINPDLTIHLHRHPAGEWVCLEAVTVAEQHGTGLAVSRLYDETGPLGRSLQSLLVERG
jgi:hypothetical protein